MKKIVIAKPGYNALSETDPNNLIFSSDYNTLKYDTSGSNTFTIPANGSAFTVEHDIVTHNLGYYPFYTSFIKEFSLEQYYSTPYSFADFLGYIYFFVYATTTKLVLRVEMSNNIADFDLTVWYKIFKNNLDL